MEHLDIPLGERHAPHNWEFADATARNSEVITDVTMILKTALQTDDHSVWVLTEVSPAAWVRQTATPAAHAHAIADVTGLQTALDGKADLVEGKVPASQLPSYVDDVLEYANLAALPATGETGKIYVTLDDNAQHRWSGSAYVTLVSSPGTTDDVPQGTVNKYFADSLVRSAVLTGLSLATNAAITATDSVLSAFGKLQKQITDALAAIAAKPDNPMTAAGDIIIGGTSGAPTRLAAGTNTHVLTLASGAPVWAAPLGGSGGDFLSGLLSSEVSVAAAATLTATAFGKMHVCSGTTADYTVGLPAVSGNEGKLIGFRMSSALTKLVTLDGNAAETIDGAATRTMWKDEVAIIYCDGTTWTKIAGKTLPLYATMRLYHATTPGTAQAIAYNTGTKVLLNQIDSSVMDMADTTNKRINIKRGAVYAVSALVFMNSGLVMTRVIAAPQRNGAALFSGESNTASTLSYPAIQIEGRPVLNAGDYVELFAHQVSANSAGGHLVGYTDTSSCILSIMEIPSW